MVPFDAFSTDAPHSSSAFCSGCAGGTQCEIFRSKVAAFGAFSRLAKEIGTRPGRFATLMLIGRNPGISQTALSRANGRDKSSLTPVLNDLDRRGLATRDRKSTR